MTLTALVDDRFGGFDGAHGGYVAGIALEAIADAVADPARTPRSLTVQLLESIAPGELLLDARLERAGRSLSSASVRALQGERTVAAGLGAFGTGRASLARTDRAMPAVPPPEDCEPLFAKPVPDAGASHVIEHRPAAPPLPLSGGDRAEILVWMRIVGTDEPSPADVVFLADSGPPALYGALSAFVPIPSIEISVHFAPDPPGSPWVLGVFRSDVAGDGYATENGELWTPEGRLVALTRQLRRLPVAGDESVG